MDKLPGRRDLSLPSGYRLVCHSLVVKNTRIMAYLTGVSSIGFKFANPDGSTKDKIRRKDLRDPEGETKESGEQRKRKRQNMLNEG